LVGSRFVQAAGAVGIDAEKTDASSVQNDIERVFGLTASTLDRLHRMRRLWRHLAWTVRELDLVFTHLGVTALTDTELVSLGQFLALQRRLGASVLDTCALTGLLPQQPVDDDPSLFDRLFNAAPFVAQDGTYPKDTTIFVHPALRSAPAPGGDDPNQLRLQAGLGVTDETLVALLRVLATPLGFNLTGPDDQRGFALTVANLSLLYRHARLAELLDLSVQDLFRLIGTVTDLPAGCVGDQADLAALLEARDWWRRSGWSLDDIAVIERRPPLDPRPYPDPATVVKTLLAQLESEQAMTFVDTVFAFLPGVTEDQSREIVQLNDARIVSAPSGAAYRLVTGFDLTAPLNIPVGLTANEQTVRDVLATYHPSRVLPSRLAGALGLDVDSVQALLELLQAAIGSGPVAAALYGEQVPDPLIALVADLVPLHVLFHDAAFDAGAIDFVRANAAALPLTDPRAIDVSTLRGVAVYADFAGARRNASDPPTYAAADVQDVLAAFTGAGKFAAADPRQLATVLATDPGAPATVDGVVPLPTPAAPALAWLSDAIALAQQLGVGGDVLGSTLSTTFATAQGAADALLAAVRARYPQNEWDANVEPLEDVVRTARRDALADYLIHSVFPQFTRLDDLYDHFLIDVRVSGCARTSRVVAAISSVQLYVYRVLMNLEQDRREPEDLAHVHVSPTLIPADEWAWRRNYRVWEANRKVFLWPENYMEPDLRNDKTPLFEELESTLLQQPIDEQSVLDAYSTNLQGVQELASLEHAGSFQEIDAVHRTDTLHIIGVTSTDPPTFYYRAVEDAVFGERMEGRGTVWGPWRKIDVQIGARKVSAVVAGGRLHLFWVEYVTKPQTSFQSGSSTFTGYRHDVSVKYTTLRLDGRWTAPQDLALRDVPPMHGQLFVWDPLNPSGVPLYDQSGLEHHEPHDDYT